MNFSRVTLALLFCLATLLHCYQIQPNYPNPSSSSPAPNCLPNPSTIQLNTITLAKNNQPLDLLQKQMAKVVPSAAKEQGVVNGQVYQTASQNNVQSQSGQLNSCSLNIGVSKGQNEKAELLKGIQKLIESSNNRVIGRLDTLETKVNQLMNQKDQIIGTISPQVAAKTGQSYPTIANILNQYGQQTNQQNGGQLSSKSPNIVTLQIGANNAAYSRNQPQEVINSYPQASQNKSVLTENSQQARVIQEAGNYQVPGVNADDTQRRIDYLQAEMLARQQKMIMSKLRQDYYVGHMGVNTACQYSSPSVCDCSGPSVCEYSSPSGCQFSSGSGCSSCGRLVVPQRYPL